MQTKDIFVDFTHNVNYKGHILEVRDKGLMRKDIVISLAGNIYRKYDISISLYYIGIPEWASIGLMQLYGQSTCGSI